MNESLLTADYESTRAHDHGHINNHAVNNGVSVAVDDQSEDHFEWKDVNVTISGKHILHNISGRVGRGQLLGILGGSGAGKTTLLNAISGRILNQRKTPISKLCKRPDTTVTGSVGYQQKEFQLGDSDSIKYISAYVMQQDIMCPIMTCREALTFSAKLRRKDTVHAQTAIINAVSESLKLDDCRDTRIGDDAIRGLSGGEKKRTSVGVELVVEPNLIFLDEPTSGLDSFTALKTMEILKGLTADQGKQVIATVHQPSSEIFQMLDILVLLAKGHVVYYGPTTDVIAYFDRLGYPCPKYTNPADYLVNRVQENSEFFIEKWKSAHSDFCQLDFRSYGILRPSMSQSSSLYLQFTELMKREFLILLRDPRPSKIRLGQVIIFSLLCGTLYWQLPYTAEGLRNRFGAIFFLTINSSMNGLIGTVVLFPQQRLLFERERDANMYYTTTYLMAKLIAQLPEQMLFVFIYVVICYWMVGFDSKFFEIYISALLSVLSVGSVGLVGGCFANNVGEALQFMPVAFVPFILFTNFMVSLDQIPVWIRWLEWIDPFKYVVDALSITEYRGQLHECIPGTDTCVYNGDEYLKQIGAGYASDNVIGNWIHTWSDSVRFDWICLVLCIIGYRFIVWLILVRRNGF